jgi:hypothetical protein
MAQTVMVNLKSNATATNTLEAMEQAQQSETETTSTTDTSGGS